jgi:hypothetical protein
MSRLALVMVYGYYKDLESDRLSDNYNPLLSEAWDMDSVVKSLIQKAKIGFLPHLDTYLSLDSIIEGFWN